MENKLLGGPSGNKGWVSSVLVRQPLPAFCPHGQDRCGPRFRTLATCRRSCALGESNAHEADLTVSGGCSDRLREHYAGADLEASWTPRRQRGFAIRRPPQFGQVVFGHRRRTCVYVER